jgi:hypothetical protein
MRNGNLANPGMVKRYAQLAECRVPTTTHKGNTLPAEGYLISEVVGTIDGIPEFIVDMNGTPYRGMESPTKGTGCKVSLKMELQDVLESLVKASGNCIDQTDLTKMDMGQRALNLDNVEFHAFYDPNNDITSYFMLPSRKLVGIL